MEVERPVQKMDFRFSSCLSAPPTPMRPGDYYFSAPASPKQLSEIYREFDGFFITNSSTNSPSSAVPVRHESSTSNKYEDDFAFDVSGEWDRSSRSAEELFDGGIIRPLKPPPTPLQHPKSPTVSPRSKLHGKEIIRSAFSPRQKKELECPIDKRREDERGRERTGRKATRSLSPSRVSQYLWEEDQEEEDHQLLSNPKESSKNSGPPSALCTFLSSSSKGSRKWRLKDFFLFRSASEGRASDRDPLKKYTSALFKRNEDMKNLSSRRTAMGMESPAPAGSVKRGRAGSRASAHELHYTANRAVSENLKKKSFLPYKQGILGRLAFNPAVHALANGFGFSISRK